MLNMLLLCTTTIVVALLLTRKEQHTVQATEIKPTIVAEFDTVSVSVPTVLIPTGTKVKAIKFHQILYPKHQIPQGALISLEDYMEAVTIAPLPANLPIFTENLTLNASSSNQVVESIPHGMRAMTLQVDATSAVEGWAGSGSIVDVLLIEKDKTAVVAEKVRILSAERSMQQLSDGESPTVPRTVTILVTQEQCLSINTAIPLGRIAFALRGTADDERWLDTSFSSEELKGKSRVVRNSDNVINGYVSIKGEGEQAGKEKKFALAGNKWVPTEGVPDGFFVTGKGNETNRPKTP